MAAAEGAEEAVRGEVDRWLVARRQPSGFSLLFTPFL
jgi:hypothetical protein